MQAALTGSSERIESRYVVDARDIAPNAVKALAADAVRCDPGLVVRQQFETLAARPRPARLCGEHSNIGKREARLARMNVLAIIQCEFSAGLTGRRRHHHW